MTTTARAIVMAGSTGMRFYIPGLPQPQGSARAFVVAGKARITSDNPKVKSWRVDAKRVFQERITKPECGPVRVNAVFEFARPKGHFGSGRNAHLVRESAPKTHTVKPDVDKLARALLDAGTGTLWRDDAQVVSLTVGKRYAEQPGTWVEVVTE